MNWHIMQQVFRVISLVATWLEHHHCRSLGVPFQHKDMHGTAYALCAARDPQNGVNVILKSK